MSSNEQATSCEGLSAQPLTASLCVVCNHEIPAKRLALMPLTTHCVSCLVALGDVPHIKRFDEYVGEEQVSTYFVNNPLIEAELRRINSEGALEQEFLKLCVGDDSFTLYPPRAVVGTDGLASAFEPEEEKEVVEYAKAA